MERREDPVLLSEIVEIPMPPRSQGHRSARDQTPRQLKHPILRPLHHHKEGPHPEFAGRGLTFLIHHSVTYTHLPTDLHSNPVLKIQGITATIFGAPLNILISHLPAAPGTNFQKILSNLSLHQTQILS